MILRTVVRGHTRHPVAASDFLVKVAVSQCPHSGLGPPPLAEGGEKFLVAEALFGEEGLVTVIRDIYLAILEDKGPPLCLRDTRLLPQGSARSKARRSSSAGLV